MSVDTVLGNLREPQSWNRYAYALGNPIAFTDPDGRQVQDATQSATPSLPEAVSDLLGYWKRHFDGNVFMSEDPQQAAAREVVNQSMGAAVGGAVLIGTFGDILGSAEPQEKNPDIRRKEGSVEDARTDFGQAVDPDSVEEIEEGKLRGEDKDTGRTLIFREQSTDREGSVATIEEQRKTESGRTRSRKVGYDPETE